MTTVVLCIDGFDPEYLETCDVPNLREMARRGFLKTGLSMMPSVTNVNNVSLVTASYPESHGICSNYRLSRETGQGTYVESSEFILAESMFQRARAQGRASVVVTAKDLTEEDRRRLDGNVATVLAKGAYTQDELLAQIQQIVSSCSAAPDLVA